MRNKSLERKNCVLGRVRFSLSNFDSEKNQLDSEKCRWQWKMSLDSEKCHWQWKMSIDSKNCHMCTFFTVKKLTVKNIVYTIFTVNDIFHCQWQISLSIDTFYCQWYLNCQLTFADKESDPKWTIQKGESGSSLK